VGKGELAIRAVAGAWLITPRLRTTGQRQALINGPADGGDTGLAGSFIRAGGSLMSNTEKVNFCCDQDGAGAREKMQKRRQLGKMLGEPEAIIDVKIDRGGIRDMNFWCSACSAFTAALSRGLRSGGTLFSLHKLHDKGHIAARNFMI